MHSQTPVSALEQPWTIGRLLEWTTKFLAQKGLESPLLDAQVLLAHTLNCPRIQLYTRYTEAANDEVRQRYKELIRRRLDGCPAAYLVGRKEFYSLEFEVTKDVLIPRPATEALVSECLRLAKGQQSPTILDLGTGSGNVPIAIAHRLKTAQLTSIDISPAALVVAKRNAEKHKVADRVRFLQGDLFEPLDPAERFALIVSNPPYIAREELAQLEPGVRDYEPHLALDGGPGGCVVLERLVTQALHFLAPTGMLLLEVGLAAQERWTREKLLSLSGYEQIQTHPDHSGLHRIVSARRMSGE